MNTVILIIVLQVVVTLLAGCAEFPIAAQMEEIRNAQEELFVRGKMSLYAQGGRYDEYFT